MAKAANLINATVDTLQLFRSDLVWQKYYNYNTDSAALHDIRVSSPRPQCQRQLPRRFDDIVIMESTGAIGRQWRLVKATRSVCIFQF